MTLTPLASGTLAAAGLLALGAGGIVLWGATRTPQDAAESSTRVSVEPAPGAILPPPPSKPVPTAPALSVRTALAGSVPSSAVDDASSALTAQLASLRGRFVTSAGEPLAGVPCRLGLGGAYLGTAHPYEVDPPAAWRDQELESDAEGRFELLFPPVPGFALGFSAALAGWCPVHVDAEELGAGEVRDLGDVVLYRAGRMQGRVLGTDGAARTGLAWRLAASPPPALVARGTYGGFASAKVDPLDASFTLEGLFPGRSWVVLQADTADEERLEVELAEGATLAQDIVYRGADPARRLRVRAAVAHGFVAPRDLAGVRLEGPGGQSIAGSVGASGELLFPELEPGEYVLACDDPRFDPVRLAGVRPGRCVELFLRPNSALLVGVRVAATGALLEPEWLSVERASSQTAPRGFEPELPLVAGRIEALLAEDYLVRARHGTLQGEVRVEALAPGETRAVTIELDAPWSVRGRAVDDAGEVLSGSELLVLRPALEFDGEDSDVLQLGHDSSAPERFRRELVRLRTGADGRFEFLLPRPEVVFLCARDALDAVSPARRLVPEPGASPQEVELVLPRLGRLAGRVQVPEGASCAGLALHVLDTSSRRNFRRGSTLALDAQGRFTLEPLEPGTYRAFLVPAPCARVRSFGNGTQQVHEELHALHADGSVENGASLGEFTLAPGALAQPEFSLAPGAWPGTLALEFLVDGQPARDFEVRLTQGDLCLARLYTDELGRLGPLAMFGGSWSVTLLDPRSAWSHAFPDPLPTPLGQATRFVLEAWR